MRRYSGLLIHVEQEGEVTTEMQNIVKITKTNRSSVKPTRRFETHKASKVGRQITLSRAQARSIKYGGAA